MHSNLAKEASKVQLILAKHIDHFAVVMKWGDF